MFCFVPHVRESFLDEDDEGRFTRCGGCRSLIHPFSLFPQPACLFITPFFPLSMFSKVFASGKASLGRIVNRSASGCSRSLHPAARSYSTGAASCTPSLSISHTASPFQIGCAVAAGLGCGAALLYGDRLFAVEVVQCDWIEDSRTRSLWAFPARTPTVLASSVTVL